MNHINHINHDVNNTVYISEKENIAKLYCFRTFDDEDIQCSIVYSDIIPDSVFDTLLDKVSIIPVKKRLTKKIKNKLKNTKRNTRKR